MKFNKNLLKMLPWIESEKQTRNVRKVYRTMSSFGKENDVKLQFPFDAGCKKQGFRNLRRCEKIDARMIQNGSQKITKWKRNQ